MLQQYRSSNGTDVHTTACTGTVGRQFFMVQSFQHEHGIVSILAIDCKLCPCAFSSLSVQDLVIRLNSLGHESNFESPDIRPIVLAIKGLQSPYTKTPSQDPCRILPMKQSNETVHPTLSMPLLNNVRKSELA